MNSSPLRILIIKPSAIGDVVHALPILPRLRKRFPSAKLTWVVTPACAGLVQNHPLIDDVLLFHRRMTGPIAGFRKLAGLVTDMQHRQFDLAIDLQGLLRSGAIAVASGAPRRIGFSNAREGASLFYTEHVDCSVAREHAVDRYLKIASVLGCEDGPVEFQFAVDDSDRAKIAQLVPDKIRYAVLLPGANWQSKRWPAEHFAALVAPIRDKFGLECVVAGGAADRTLAAQIGAKFDLTGNTNLREMVALLERADLVIANDTGPMHIAAALNRPLVCPYGPTSPIRTGPYGRLDSVIRVEIPCSPCFSRTCKHQSCLIWLRPDSAMEFAERQILKIFKNNAK